MATTFTIGATDIWPYTEAGSDAGFDPIDADHFEPQFGGSEALRSGLEWITDTEGLREWTVPLILSAASVDGLSTLERTINAAITPGTTVTWQMDGASNPTYFDLARGRLDVQWQYWMGQSKRLRATLHLWTQPHGRTQSPRTVATLAGTGPQLMALPSVTGTVDALANLEVRVGSSIASGGRMIAYGVHPHPSYQPLHQPTTGNAQAGASLTGASGAVASQFVGIPVSPTTASGVAYTWPLSPPDAYVGRHRVLGIGRSRLDQPIIAHAQDRWGNPLGATVSFPTSDPLKWAVRDLGEIQIEARVSGQEAVASQAIRIIAGGGPGASTVASPAFELNQVVLIPLDESPGIMRTAGLRDAFLDTFARGESGQLLQAEPNPDTGPPWQRIGGQMVFLQATAANRTMLLPAFSSAGPTATGAYCVASSPNLGNVDASWETQLYAAASMYASGAAIGVSPKASVARIEISFGPSPNLALYAELTAGPSLVASAAISTGATALRAGQPFRIGARMTGNLCDIWMATGALFQGSPFISATNAHFANFGAGPAIRGRSSTGGVVALNWVNLVETGATPADILPREYFRFDSHPEPRSIQSNASVFVGDRTADFRGVHPQVPVGGSGPPRMVVLAGDPDDFVGNDRIDVRLDVVERFRFFR